LAWPGGAMMSSPPWYLGNFSDESLLFLTSSDSMASHFSMVVKSVLEGNEYHAEVFPENEARPDPRRGWSSDGLYLRGIPLGSKDPSYRGLGFGASVVGARAHGILLDDPLTQEEARSPTVVAKARQFHDMTLDARLHPDGWELAIMTRWHENDLAAHLAAKDEWDVLEMPAISETGEALWPERYPLAWLEAKRASIGGPLFSALYQGDPSALGGDVFKASAWFRPLPADFFERRADGKAPRDRLVSSGARTASPRAIGSWCCRPGTWRSPSRPQLTTPPASPSGSTPASTPSSCTSTAADSACHRPATRWWS
jgi:hypothetical protein